MQTDYKTIKKHFEKSMANYNKNAIVQDLTAQKMVEELVKISSDFDNILELGSGTGLLTKKIAKNLKFHDFYANDLIEKSQIYVEKYIPNARFFRGNALKIKPNVKMDLIISNAMFQWFDNFEKAITAIKNSIDSSGLLVFSSFLPNNFKQIREITGLTLNYKTEEEIKNTLKDLGFNILYCEKFSKDMEFKTPLELLAHLKNTGVNSLSEKTWTITKIREFCEKYSQKYPTPILTYCPIIFIAQLQG